MTDKTKQVGNAEPQQLQTWRVYVAKVNETMIEVQAYDADEAKHKGYTKWRRDYAHSRVFDVELAPQNHSCTE